ncbi:hypothetical protein OB905_07915 [Halobacteria archaeon AArc-dxtr1]|nr:hypothetical protein [Halobacteria archaeon AArc-dxtr1]
MTDRIPVLMVAEALAFGALVPTTSLYVVTGPLATPLSPLGDTVLVGWLAAIAIGTTVLGVWRRLSTGALLGGALIGLVVGLAGFAALLGWSFVMFALVPIGAVAVVLGAWIAYERARSRDDVHSEPPYGTWRHLFTLLVVSPLILLVFLF